MAFIEGMAVEVEACKPPWAWLWMLVALLPLLWPMLLEVGLFGREFAVVRLPERRCWWSGRLGIRLSLCCCEWGGGGGRTPAVGGGWERECEWWLAWVVWWARGTRALGRDDEVGDEFWFVFWPWLRLWLRVGVELLELEVEIRAEVDTEGEARFRLRLLRLLLLVARPRCRFGFERECECDGDDAEAE